jgi:hypothetical protein
MRTNKTTILLPLVSVTLAKLAPVFVDTFIAGQDTSARPPAPKAWTGSNRSRKYYRLYPGYPAYQTHPRYLGVLSGLLTPIMWKPTTVTTSRMLTTNPTR